MSFTADNRGDFFRAPLIEMTAGVCGGSPCIAGHRIQAALIYEKSLTMSVEQIIADYPQLLQRDILAAILWIQEHPGYWHEWRQEQVEA